MIGRPFGAGFAAAVVFLVIMPNDSIRYSVSPALTDDELNNLFRASWPDYEAHSFSNQLRVSLAWVAAQDGDRLIGFVNLAWDGYAHAFLLDTTVHPQWRRQGIGGKLVRTAIDVAHSRNLEWVHVDYEPSLDSFYASCGFSPSAAGVLRLT
jgi:GNAT superfamily N-acetyltransferase